MKTKISYLFLLSNLMVFLGSLIIFLIYYVDIKSDKLINLIYQDNLWTIALAIIAVILSSLVIWIYFVLLNRQLKNEYITFSNRYRNAFKLALGLTFFNNLICLIFQLVGILSIVEINIIVMLSIALAISSIIFILFIFYSYYLDIGYNFSIDSQKQKGEKL